MSSTTSSEAAKAVVRRNTEEVQGKGNFDVFEELFADDFLDHTPQPNMTPDKSGARGLYKALREAFPDFHDTVPGFLIRDNDGAHGEAFTRRLRAMGIRDRPIAPRSPWQNGYVERSIGSIRRECLDHVIIWGEAHLRHALRAYTAYSNATRTHLGIDKNAPNRRPIESCGVIVANAVLGGLHHRYARI